MEFEMTTQEEFDQLLAGMTAERAERIAEQMARLIAEGTADERVSGTWPPRAAVALLTALTLHPDQVIAERATGILFREGIEPINDSFAAGSEEVYRRLFAQVISAWRLHPEGRFLDESLCRFSLPTEQHLVARHAGLARQPAPSKDEGSIVRKVLFLSRVTIGADVAITSALMAGVRNALPDAERVLLGAARLGELYGQERGLRIRPIDYPRGGSLLARLRSWPVTLDAVAEEMAGADPGEVWVIDPDSRLTQLGLLPLVGSDRGYYHFPSRATIVAGQSAHGQSLGHLAAHWIHNLLCQASTREATTIASEEGVPHQILPYLAVPTHWLEMGAAIADWLRSDPTRPSANLTTVSLGVGGNTKKRLPTEYETAILRQLSARGPVVLDTGGSTEERAAVEAVVAPLRAEGWEIAQAGQEGDLANLLRSSLRPTVLLWEGGIGSLAGLIAASDRYLGYDSSGQHLAAALGTPGWTLFLSDNPTAFADRWHPTGRGSATLLFASPTPPLASLLADLASLGD